jgi:hypothetical protein
VLWNSVIKAGTLGENIEDEISAMNVMAETRRIRDYQRRGD